MILFFSIDDPPFPPSRSLSLGSVTCSRARVHDAHSPSLRAWLQRIPAVQFLSLSLSAVSRVCSDDYRRFILISPWDVLLALIEISRSPCTNSTTLPKHHQNMSSAINLSLLALSLSLSPLHTRQVLKSTVTSFADVISFEG